MVVAGTVRCEGIVPAQDRSDFAQEPSTVFPVLLTDARVWDAIATVLPGTSATDDLALDGGTFGTSPPTIRTSDLKAAGATTRYCRFPNVRIPDNYDTGYTVKLRISGGMITTAADTAATVDVEAWRIDKDGTIGASDLCATAAQSINDTAFADKEFILTPTTLEPGDILDIRITVTVNDGATGTAVIGAIAAIDLLVDTKG